MFPILFRTEFGFVYTFSIVWAIGLVLIIFWLRQRSGRFQTPPLENWLVGVMLTLLSGILIGRAGFVMREWPYFQENQGEIVRIALGGQAYWGVLIGAMAAWLIWGRIQRWEWRLIWLWPMPMAPLLHMTGWAACYFEGCAAGRTSTIGWLTAELPDQFGVIDVRYQTQLVGALACAILLIFVSWFERDRAAQIAGWLLPPLVTLSIFFFWT